MSFFTPIANFFLTLFSFILSIPKKINIQNIFIAIVLIITILLIYKIAATFLIPLFFPHEHVDEKEFIIPPTWVKEGKTIPIGSLLQLSIDEIAIGTGGVQDYGVVRIEPEEEIKFFDAYSYINPVGRAIQVKNAAIISKGHSKDYEYRNAKYRVGILNIIVFNFGQFRFAWAKIKVSVIK